MEGFPDMVSKYSQFPSHVSRLGISDTRDKLSTHAAGSAERERERVATKGRPTDRRGETVTVEGWRRGDWRLRRLRDTYTHEGIEERESGRVEECA